MGVGDPNPLVASEGIATLESAGIEVRDGSDEWEGGLRGVGGKRRDTGEHRNEERSDKRGRRDKGVGVKEN